MDDDYVLRKHDRSAVVPALQTNDYECSGTGDLYTGRVRRGGSACSAYCSPDFLFYPSFIRLFVILSP